MPERHKTRLGSAPGAMRAAIEQTFEATAGSAAQRRDRATAIFNEITELGRQARRRAEKRGRAARKLIKRRRRVAEWMLEDLREAIEQIQHKLRP
ncbi:MAG: hypothetical protein ABR536_05875 [Solirubrobacterales bacterium]